MLLGIDVGTGRTRAVLVNRRGLLLALLIFPFWITMLAVAQKTDTFVIKIALPTPAIHIGDVLTIEETVSNPTNHMVAVGEGRGAGSMVELLDAKGEDLGQHAMGGASIKNQYEDLPTTLNTGKRMLGPGTNTKMIWHYTPDPESLAPGTYRLRTHIRDMKSGADVYSNTVVLTVLP